MQRKEQEKRHGEKDEGTQHKEAPAQRPGTTPGGPLPEGNGATNEPPVFPPHN